MDITYLIYSDKDNIGLLYTTSFRYPLFSNGFSSEKHTNTHIQKKTTHVVIFCLIIFLLFQRVAATGHRFFKIQRGKTTHGEISHLPRQQ